MTVTWTSVLFQALNFLVLVALLRRLFFRRLLEAIAERQRVVQAELDQAAQRAREAQEDRAAAASARAGVAAEAAQARAAAREAAEAETARLLAEGRQRLEEARAAERERQEEERARAATQLGGVAAGLAARMASRLLEDAAVRATPTLLRQALEQLEALPAGRREALRRGLADGPAELVSAEDPGPELRAEAARRLASALDLDPDRVTHAVDPDLLAGVELRLGPSVLAHHWRRALQQLEEEVQRAPAAA